MPEVAIHRQPRRQRPDAAGESVTGVGDGGTAEIQRIAGAVEDDFDDVRIDEIGSVVERMRGRRDVGVAMGFQVFRDPAYQCRRDQRLVALDVHHDAPRPEAPQRRDLGEPVGAGRMVLARHHDVDSRVAALRRRCRRDRSLR